jgi:regulator of protease activity HflC (stomatin/prohibitin superfamily)
VKLSFRNVRFNRSFTSQQAEARTERAREQAEARTERAREQAEARTERAREQAEATARKPERALALVVFSLYQKFLSCTSGAKRSAFATEKANGQRKGSRLSRTLEKLDSRSEALRVNERL